MLELAPIRETATQTNTYHDFRADFLSPLFSCSVFNSRQFARQLPRLLYNMTLELTFPALSLRADAATRANSRDTSLLVKWLRAEKFSALFLVRVCACVCVCVSGCVWVCESEWIRGASLLAAKVTIEHMMT